MGGYAYSDDSGSAVIGSGTPPQLAYFSGANQIASTPNAQHGTNDIIFNKGVAFKTENKAADYTVLPTDTYVGGGLRLVPITFTLPAIATVAEGHIFFIKDESGQSPGLPVIAAAQMGEAIDGAASLSTVVPYESFFIQKRGTEYRLIG